jgi:cell division protein FtsZ
MNDAGSALMGIGMASGENRAPEAAKAAISSPLLEASIEGAQGVLLNISGGSDLGLFEVNEAAEVVANAAHPDANIIFGAVVDPTLEDNVKVIVIATGFEIRRKQEKLEFVSEREPVPSFDAEDLDIPTFLRKREL